MCDDTNIAVPFSLANFFNISLNSLIPTGSNPFVGSSNIKTFGECNKDKASPALCFIPKE